MVHNVNIGVLGHVDSGKTSLVRKLSTVLSTAALDKHPQSQARGITLDLGFSSLQLSPEIQLTLVDCPGHASLFKTILTGLQIIDMVLLVVDVTKGLQPQTMECLVLAQQVVQKNLVVVLNKLDLVQPHALRTRRIQQVTQEIHDFLLKNFPIVFESREAIVARVPIVTVSTKEPDPKDPKDPQVNEDADLVTQSFQTLQETLRATIKVPQRDPNGAFAFAVDHCFGVSGGGTILTGTVLTGTIAVNDAIWFPQLQLTKKVKSIQMFRQSVTKAIQGDRIGMRVLGLDPSLLERGVGLSPNNAEYATKVHNLIIACQPVSLFQQSIKSGTKVHATIGHVTVMATITCFRSATMGANSANSELTKSFSVDQAYDFVDEMHCNPSNEDAVHVNSDVTTTATTSFQPSDQCFVLLRLEQEVLCHHQAVVVCSRLDLDPKRFACRVAFFGQVQCFVTSDDDPSNSTTTTPTTTTTTTTPPSKDQQDPVSAPSPSTTRFVGFNRLQIGKVKEKTGFIEKVLGHAHVKSMKPTSGIDTVNSKQEVIVRDLFGKETDLQVFVGLEVLLTTSKRLGRIVGSFGKAGKCRVELLADEEHDSKDQVSPSVSVGEHVVLRFRKHLFQSKRSQQQKKRNLHQDRSVVYPEWRRAVEERRLQCRQNQQRQQQQQQQQQPPHNEPSDTAPFLQGTVERLKGETSADGRNPFVIVTGMFESLELAEKYVGKEIWYVNAISGHKETGVVEKPFGKSGKVRVSFEKCQGTSAHIGDLVFATT